MSSPDAFPARVQRRRSRGWRTPPNTVYVGRPTEWGSPWLVGESLIIQYPAYAAVDVQVRELVVTPALAVALYRECFAPDIPDAVRQLRGKNLACWCPLDRPCHADVLLEWANGPLPARDPPGLPLRPSRLPSDLRD